MKKIKEELGEWYDLLHLEFTKDYMKRLSANLRVARMKTTILPLKENVFRAYRLTQPNDIKVVILGQDPYHSLIEQQPIANGLAFSCVETLDKIPPSLRNIFKELEEDIGFIPYHNPDLERWAKQGVFLLNTTLTVQQNLPNSHHDWGWKLFTHKTIETLCKMDKPIVYLLWGRIAQEYINLIPNHQCAIVSSHPSPFSAYRGFFGTKPFSRANEWLIQHKLQPINWLKDS